MLRYTCSAFFDWGSSEGSLVGKISSGSNDVLENTVAGGHLDGLAVQTAL